MCTAADMAAVPPSASFRFSSEGPRPIALRISVEPFEAAIIAAVLPEFCEARTRGMVRVGGIGQTRSEVWDSRGAARRSAGKKRVGKKRTSANERACVDRWRLCVSTRRAARDRGRLADSDRRDRGAMIHGDASIAGPDETGSRSSCPGDERASRPCSRKARPDAPRRWPGCRRPRPRRGARRLCRRSRPLPRPEAASGR